MSLAAESLPPAAPAVRAAASAFSIEGPSAFAEDGERRDVGEGMEMLRRLAEAVYRRCHLGLVGYSEPESVPMRAREDPDVVRRLRAARPGRRYADEGWTLLERRADHLVVCKDRLRLRAPAGWAEQSPSGWSLWFPAERRLGLPGYYVALGASGPPVAERRLVRLYLHAKPQCAPRLLAALVDALDGRALRFQLKLANRLASYRRPDACVLYVDADQRNLASDLALALPRSWLLPSTPGFSRRLAGGVAVAEGSGESWGRHCANAVASGLCAAFETGEEPLEAVCGALARMGIDPSAPDGLDS
ncbi:MAG TPA: T3SS effector HopA1 family protein [Acidimicrobiales bacterium]|nr:T3SS effector HopA1 family protein [Acidimicrobiales bacterium]